MNKMELAKALIESEAFIALDVAENHGKVFKNVKHEHWFITAVAEEIEDEFD